jgi:hypothetical protein
MEMTMPNIQFKCPHCNQPIETPSEMLGQLIECPSCSQTVEVLKLPTRPSLAPIPLHRVAPKLKLPRPPQNIKKALKLIEYKVLTQRDKWFAGNFDLDKLEQAINSYAAQGWQVMSVTTARVPAVPEGHRDELVVIMRRDK